VQSLTAALPASAAPSERGASPAAWYALAVLTVVTLFAVVDRGVLVLQAETIRLSLGLSDLQLGFLQGTSVAVMVALVTYPLGWLADRFERRLVLCGCVVFWSLAVLGSGLSHSYLALLIFSALVGAGEAGLGPIANALIPDLFSEKKRQLANSIYALATTGASALGIVLTGLIIGNVDSVRPVLPAPLAGLEAWRLSFFIVAMPAPLMMLLIASIRIRPRPAEAARPDPASMPISPSAEPAPLSHALPLLPYLRLHAATFLTFYGGIGAMVFGFGALGGWLAVIYQRVFGQTPQQIGAVVGGIAAAATAVGFLLSVYGMRFLAPRLGPKMNIRVVWVSALCAGAVLSLMLFATQARQMYAIHGIYIMLLTSATMIYPTVVQSLSPRRLRARASAVLGVVMSGSGAIAPPIVGLVSDQFKQLHNGLIVASVLVAVPALLAGACLLFWSERGYLATKAAAETVDAGAP
jgi:MFS family permease